MPTRVVGAANTGSKQNNSLAPDSAPEPAAGPAPPRSAAAGVVGAPEGFFKALTADPRRPFTPQELLSYSFRHPVLFEPGAKFDYCNTNLILLGLVVEKLSGTPLNRYVDERVVKPAGLHHTFFPTGAEFPEPHAQGYTDQTASGKTEDAAAYEGNEPSTLFGEAITRIVTPRHVFSLPAQPVTGH